VDAEAWRLAAGNKGLSAGQKRYSALRAKLFYGIRALHITGSGKEVKMSKTINNKSTEAAVTFVLAPAPAFLRGMTACASGGTAGKKYTTMLNVIERSL
jgi:hypothetical protein